MTVAQQCRHDKAWRLQSTLTNGSAFLHLAFLRLAIPIPRRNPKPYSQSLFLLIPNFKIIPKRRYNYEMNKQNDDCFKTCLFNSKINFHLILFTLKNKSTSTIHWNVYSVIQKIVTQLNVVNELGLIKSILKNYGPNWD